MNTKFKKFFLTLVTVIVVAFCTLLAACGEPEAVDQGSIKYDGKTITWNAVEGADGYTIQIDGEKEYSSSTNKFLYTVKADVEQVEITITAKAGDKAGESASKIFNRLPKIEKEDITFDENGKMSWTQVEGANEYVLKINDKEIRTAALEYNEFEKGKTNKIQIKPMAIDDSSFSDWSVEISKDYLAMPSDVKYDGQYLTWTGIGKSARYAVYVNGALYDEVDGTLVDYDAKNNNFDVTVKTLGDKVNSFDSDECEASSFVFLGEVEGFNVTDGRLTWEEVEGAQGYQIRVNDVDKGIVETNAYDDIQAGKKIRISVKPVTQEGTAYFASWSPDQEVHLLPAPELSWHGGLELNGQVANVVSWEVVEGDVAGYNFKVIEPNGDENVYTLGTDITEFGAEQKETFEEEGEYRLSIQTIPVDGTGAYHSAYSDPIIVTRLASPNAPVREFVKSNPTSIKDGISIKWNPVTAASGYAIYKDEQLLRDNHTNTVVNVNYADIISADETDGKQINFFIQSLGSIKKFGNETRVNLSSLPSKNLKAEVTVLAQPKNIQFNEYIASWENVTNAAKYGVKCVGDAITTEVAEYDLKNLEAGSATLSVCAAGDGGQLLASNYTSGIKIVRLQAPTNIKLAPANDGDMLQWDGGANPKAALYEVYWSGSETAFANSNSAINMREYITEGSKTLFMRAVANKLDETTGTYYVTSKASLTETFTKLAAPTFNTEKVDVDQKNLIWNAPNNVTGIDIRYRVYNYDVRQDKIADTTAFDISDNELYPSGSYEFRVEAYSDHGHYISSDKSGDASFVKLATPNVVRDGAAYTWEEVSGALGYYAQYGDKTKNLSASEFSFEPGDAFAAPGKTYSVEVYAKGNRIETINSASWAETQETKRASVPEFSLTYCNADGEEVTQHETGGYIAITITYESNYTYEYEVKIGGTSHSFFKELEGYRNEEELLTCKFYVETPGAYTVEVYAKGGKFGTAPDKKYYVKSQSDDAQTITIYDAVSQLDKTQSQITWKFDGEAKYGYTVKITLKNDQVIEVPTKNKQVMYNDIECVDVEGNPIEIDGVEITKLTADHIEAVEVIVKGGKSTTGTYIASKPTNI